MKRAEIPLYREGDEFTLRLYPNLLEDGRLNPNYNIGSKTVKLELYAPDNPEPIIVDPLIDQSDKADCGEFVVIYTVPAGTTTGFIGTWKAIIYVEEDHLTLGTAYFKVVERTDSIASEGYC